MDHLSSLPPALPPPPPPNWPKVIGIIGIVVGGWGILSGTGSFFTDKMVGAMSSAGIQPYSPEAIEEIKRFSRIGGLGSMVSGLFLVIASIFILRRRSPGRGLMLAWAVGRVGLALGMIPLTLNYMEMIMRDLARTGKVGPGKAAMTGIMDIGVQVGVYGGLVASCAIPVFIFIWFNLKPVKAYTASWGDRTGEG